MLAAALLQLVLQYHGSALRARGRFGAVSGSAVAQALLGGGLGLDVSAGRAYARQFFEGRDALSRGVSKTNLPDCWIAGARLTWRM